MLLPLLLLPLLLLAAPARAQVLSLSCDDETATGVTVTGNCFAATVMSGGAVGCFILRTPVDVLPIDNADLSTDALQLDALRADGLLATFPEDLIYGTMSFSPGSTETHTFEGAGRFRFSIYVIDFFAGDAFGRVNDEGLVCGIATAALTVSGGLSATVIGDEDFTPSAEDGSLVTLPIGVAGASTFVLTAEGDLTVTAVTLFTSHDEFSVAPSASLPADLADGDVLPFDVAFAAAPAGEYSATVRISTGTGTTVSFRVTVNVEALPVVDLVPAETVTVNLVDADASAVLSAKISNSGDARLDLGAAVLSGDVDFFALTSLTQDSSVNVGGSTTLRVKYAPTATGEHRVRATIASNLPTGSVVVDFVATAVALKYAAVVINDEDQTQYDAGPVFITASGVLDVPVALSATGGDIAIISAQTTGDLSLTASLAGVVVATGDSLALSVQLALQVDVVTSGSLVLVTDDEVEPTKTLTFSARGLAAGLLTASAAGTSLNAASPLVLPTVVPSLTTAAATVTLTNAGAAEATVENVVLAGAVSGLALVSAPNGRVLSPGASATFSVSFAPVQDATVTTATISATLASGMTLSFDVKVSTGPVVWASSVLPAYTLREGQSIDLGVTFPSAIGNADLTMLTSLVAAQTSTSTDDISVSVSATDTAEATVSVLVVDDDDVEAAEAAVFQLISGGATVTVNVPASDQKTDTAVLDPNGTVTVTASGDKPGDAQDDGIVRGSVNVHIAASDTVRLDGSSGSGSVVVRIVEDDDVEGDLAVTNFSILDESRNDGSRLETAGTSFTIELDDGVVLASEIEVDSKFECGTVAGDLVLLLFDLQASPPAWVPADSMCDVPVAPVVDADACVATFTICHLTQFVIAKRVASTTSPSNAVSDSASGADGQSNSDDGLADGWIAVIVIGAVLALGLCCFCVVLAMRRKKTDEKTEEVAIDDALESGEISSSSNDNASLSASRSASSSDDVSSSDDASSSDDGSSSGSSEES